MRFLLASALLLISSSLFAQDPNCGRPQAYSYAPVYGYSAPVGGIIDNTIDSAVDRFVNNYEFKMSIVRRQPASVSYSVPTYSYAAPVYSAPTYYLPTAQPVYYAAAPVFVPTAPVVPRTYSYTKVYPSGRVKTQIYSWGP